jgi:hypothetical protein
MELLNPQYLNLNYKALQKAEDTKNKIYNIVVTSGSKCSKFMSYEDLKRSTMAYKSARQEASNQDEFETYFHNLQGGIEYVLARIQDESEEHLMFDHKDFILMNGVLSPETHKNHPGTYRKDGVLVGRHAPPHHTEVDGTMNEFIYHLDKIENPILKAAYCHFETVRIHPFSDGNGRTARLMANWILMENLYMPTYIKLNEVEGYIGNLSDSFEELQKNNGFPGVHTSKCFNTTINRIQKSLDRSLEFVLSQSEEMPSVDINIRGVDQEHINGIKNSLKRSLNLTHNKPVGITLIDEEKSYHQKDIILRVMGMDEKEIGKLKKAVNNYSRHDKNLKKMKVTYN